VSDSNTVRVRATHTVHVPGYGLLEAGAEIDLDADAARGPLAEGVVTKAPQSAAKSQTKPQTKETS